MMTRFRNQREVSEALERYLGYAVNESIWSYLTSKFYVSEVLKGDTDLPRLAAEYRRLAGLGRQPNRGQPERKSHEQTELPADERLEILSALVAEDAAAQPDVQDFRHVVLDDKLLRFEQVGNWIERRAEAEGPPSRFLALPVPSEYTIEAGRDGLWPDPALTISREAPASEAFSRVLAYLVEGEHWVHYVSVKHGGDLDSLRRVSEALAKRCDWLDERATVFVLTGIAPPLSAARITITTRLPIGIPGLLRRIRLDLDPTLSPRAVADIYRKHRTSLLEGRYRPMSPKHLRLAKFSHAKEGSWRERMEAWNNIYPDWRYTNLRNFSRDSRHAWRRLIGEES